MKIIRCFFLTLMVLVTLTIGWTEVFAINTGFSTEVLPEDDVKTILENINLSVFTVEPRKSEIDCFDVNENGLIAIGSNTGNIKTVCVYSNDGTFLYGYNFKTNGKFGIEFDDSSLNIYFVRSDVAISITSKGEIESVCKIQNTPSNTSYWNNNIFSITRKHKEDTYMLMNDMGILNLFASSYSQLTKVNSEGEQSVIYDVNSTYLFKTLVMFVCVIVFVGVAIFIVVRLIKNNNTKGRLALKPHR